MMANRKKKLRIGLMSYAMDHRAAKGTALYTRKLIEEFLREGNNDFEFTLIHYEHVDDPLYRKASEIIMPKIRLPYGAHLVSQLLFYWKYRKEQFDAIHWFQPRLYPFYWLAPARKLVVTVHGAGQITLKTKQFDLSKEVFNLVMSRLNSRVDAFIADSFFGRKEIIAHYHTRPERTHTVPLGVDLKFKALAKKEAAETVALYGITGPYILDVSRLQPHKNVISLVKAYIEMRTAYRERNEKLVIVGAPLAGSEATYDAARKSAFSEDIIFVDFVKDEHLNHFYSVAELFVFPSLLEGFGLPLIEAMAAGVPIITSNTSSLPEVGGEAVLLVDPLNIADIKETMNRALSDPALLDDLRNKGLARAKTFTWQKTKEGTEAVYHALLG